MGSLNEVNVRLISHYPNYNLPTYALFVLFKSSWAIFRFALSVHAMAKSTAISLLTTVNVHFLRICKANRSPRRMCLVTYIIGHYNTSVRITTQHLTPFMLCALILYMSVGDLQHRDDSEQQFFSLRNFFMAILFTPSVFARNLLRGSHWKNIFIF